jgi:hypothetical protein
MRKTLLIFIIILFTIATTNANSVDFYGEKDNSWWLWNSQISELEWKINLLQDKTWLNTDIVILWKWDKYWCYNIPNFDNCVKTKYWYWSDIIIVLKMKSDISSRWDIRSYMDNKNFPIITTSILKNIQDKIVYNFKNNDFKKWLLEYYNKLELTINNSCHKILDENKSFWWKLYDSDCNISSLIKAYNQNELLRTKAEKNASFMRNIYIWISLFIFTLFMIVMHIFYLWRLKKVFNDIKFQLIDIEDNKTFKKDIQNTKNELEKLIKKIEIYLWNADKNWIKLRKYYLGVDKKSNEIKANYEKSIENFNSQKKINKEIEDFKNINI